MKALKEMNNTERALVLAEMFPDELKQLTAFIESEIKFFREHENEIRKSWDVNFIATPDY